MMRMGSGCFHVRFHGNDTIVDMNLREGKRFLSNSVETEALSPHRNNAECTCVDVEHVPKFYLKTKSVEKSETCGRTDLYIACEPKDAIDIKCEVGGFYSVYSVHMDGFHGWKYLKTIHYCFNDSMILFLKLNLYTDKKVKLDIPGIAKMDIPSGQDHNICDDLSKILTEEIYSDVTVSSDEGTRIKAHRAILARRSEVFHAAIKNKESNDDNITTPFKEDILRQILTYIYTDKSPNPEDITADLFAAADYYHLSGLQTACLVTFCKQVTVDNAVATLHLAEKYSLTALLNYTLKYIKGRFDKIVETEDWKNMESMAMMRMISEFVANDMPVILGDKEKESSDRPN